MAAPKGNKNAAGNKGGGRPSSYRPEFAKIAASMCKLGATDIDLAVAFEVGTTTINAWKSEFIEFSEALKVGKDVADDLVERSLYQRAVGYTFDSEKVFNGKDGIVRTATREHVPPDVTAQIFWLKNRRKADWRDKQEIEHSGSVDLTKRMEEGLARARKRDG